MLQVLCVLFWGWHCTGARQDSGHGAGLGGLAYKLGHDLLRVGHAALKPGSKCSFTARKLRFFA
jgi:hypothetical protein